MGLVAVTELIISTADWPIHVHPLYSRGDNNNLVGELPGYSTVWFHPDGIANILSLSRVKTKYRITFGSDENNEFIVHKPDGSTRNFKESSHDLFYHDTSTEVTGMAETWTALVTTVVHNASNYTHADYSRALLARKNTTNHWMTEHTGLHLIRGEQPHPQLSSN